jgi:glucose-1-phosphate thymidylyltransferase
MSRCYGILPMAGKGKRIQPIAFSKELYPVVYRGRHFAVSEFSIKAMLKARVDEIRLVINPDKLDIVKYYAKYKAPIAMYFNRSRNQPESCLFPIKTMDLEDICLYGLPDTIFQPNDGFMKLRRVLERGADVAIGLFKVEDGTKFDSVALDKKNRVLAIKPKYHPPALSQYIWGIWGAKVKALLKLKRVIDQQKPKKGEEKILGVGLGDLAKDKTLKVMGVKLSKFYLDIGTASAVLEVQQSLKDA